MERILGGLSGQNGHNVSPITVLIIWDQEQENDFVIIIRKVKFEVFQNEWAKITLLSQRTEIIIIFIYRVVRVAAIFMLPCQNLKESDGATILIVRVKVILG